MPNAPCELLVVPREKAALECQKLDRLQGVKTVQDSSTREVCGFDPNAGASRAIGNVTSKRALPQDPTNSEDTPMDKDRIEGSAQQAKGAVKEAAGKVFGDKKLETEGKTDKAVGKVQNAIGGLKDAVRGK
jgi:uncharacterized protein YjbJ (UPF0337 family)